MLKTFPFWCWLIISSTLIVAVGRFLVPGHDLSLPGTYEALTHIWVGIMLTISVVYWQHIGGKLCALALFLTTIQETIMFMLR